MALTIFYQKELYRICPGLNYWAFSHYHPCGGLLVCSSGFGGPGQNPGPYGRIVVQDLPCFAFDNHIVVLYIVKSILIPLFITRNCGGTKSGLRVPSTRQRFFLTMRSLRPFLSFFFLILICR